MNVMSFDPELCTQCGICIEICPLGLIFRNTENMPYIPDKMQYVCAKCGNCEAFCPTDAISPLFDTEHSVIDDAVLPTITPEQLGLYMRKRRSIRNYKAEPVDRAVIENMLDIVRYAPSGVNNQPVHWLIVHDPAKVQKLTRITIDWMREVVGSDTANPMKPVMQGLITAYDSGKDPICRGAPHVAIAHALADNPMAYTDSIIALSWFELVAPAFGIGACWGGFLKIAATSCKTLIDELGLPEGHAVQYAMMFGYPKYEARNIPGRIPARITWK
jgi:nitroreductase/NAD-dependent dihydropyrimidine dehydrogenase PreA subunit